MYPTKKLWEICEITTWKKDANYSTDDWKYPFFTCWREILKSPWYSFDTDAILIAWNWDVWAFKKFKWKFEAYQRTYVLDNFQNIEKDFLFYFLDWNLKKELLNETLWSAIPYIKLWSLQNREIPLPPLSTQKLIVEKLDMIFAEIEKSKNLLEKNLQNVDEMNKSVLEKIFANDEWERKKLGEVCEILLWWTPARDEKDFWWWENLWCSIADMKTKIISDTKEKITDEGVKNSNVKLLKQGTLFMSFKLSIWKLAFAGKDLFTNEAIAWLPINDENILNKEFLYYVLLWYDFSRQWSDNSVKGATLNKAKLINLEIPLPPLSTQKCIVEKLDMIFAENQKLKNLYQAQIKNLDEMKQSFLKKAFAGELV